MCDQCGAEAATVATEHGLLCRRCAYRQEAHDQARESFLHLSPSTFGFDPGDDDPYDD